MKKKSTNSIKSIYGYKGCFGCQYNFQGDQNIEMEACCLKGEGETFTKWWKDNGSKNPHFDHISSNKCHEPWESIARLEELLNDVKRIKDHV